MKLMKPVTTFFRLGLHQILLGFGLMTLISGSSLAQNGQLELLGRWPRGLTHAVAIDNGKAYFGDGGNLIIADVIESGELDNHRATTIDGTVRDLKIIGTTLYLAAGRHGLQVFDVSNPDMPTQMSVLPFSDYVRKLEVDGDYAYLMNNRSENDPFFVDGIHIVDISDPGNPVATGFWQTDPARLQDFEVFGTTMYVADWSIQGIRVVDISNPASPQTVASFTTEFNVAGLARSGNNLFLGLERDGGLKVLDITSPMTPVDTNASLDLGTHSGSASDFAEMAVYGDLLVMCSTGGPSFSFKGVLILVDVATPTAPALINQFSLGLNYNGNLQFCSQTDMEGTRLYFASLHDLLVYDFSNLQAPELIAAYPSGGTHLNIWVDHDKLYTASLVGGMHILDVTDPQNIQEVGLVSREDVPFEHSWQDVFVRDGIAYGALRSRVANFDVTDPADVQMLASFPSGSSFRLAFDDSHLYTMGRTNNHAIYDIIGNIQQAGTFTSEHVSTEQILVHNNLLFLSHFFDGVSIYSLSSPSSPAQTGEFETPVFGGSVGLAAIGDHLLVTDFINGVLRTVDISNPSTPVQRGVVDLGPSLSTVAVDGSFAYAGGRDSNLFLVDITDPTSPSRIAEYDGIGEGVRDIFVADDRVFVSASFSADEFPSSGVYIFRNALATSVDDLGDSYTIKGFSLGPNYPNPFNPTTTIPFHLEKGGHVTLSVYTLTGRLVQRLVDSWQPAGSHQVVWQAKDLSSGVYFVQLRSGEKVQIRRGILLK